MEREIEQIHEQYQQEQKEKDQKAVDDFIASPEAVSLKAAYKGADHICPQYKGDTPHKGGQVEIVNQSNVLINDKPAARLGDFTACDGVGLKNDMIVQGVYYVEVEGKYAARIGCTTSHEGVIIEGAEHVKIGGPIITLIPDNERRIRFQVNVQIYLDVFGGIGFKIKIKNAKIILEPLKGNLSAEFGTKLDQEGFQHSFEKKSSMESKVSVEVGNKKWGGKLRTIEDGEFTKKVIFSDSKEFFQNEDVKVFNPYANIGRSFSSSSNETSLGIFFDAGVEASNPARILILGGKVGVKGNAKIIW
jgi:uncharacterized Zn-binding protein involved in type VI secretion